MDLHQLRIFVAIATSGNLTRASEILFLSQPAVSAQIKALEEELGLSLFNRHARGMELTSPGKVLLADASSALNAAKNIEHQAKQLRDGISGNFKLGTISEPVILHLGQLLTTMLSRHPNLQLSLTQGISGEIIDKVLDGRVNAGYVIGQIEHRDLVSLEISTIPLRIVAPTAWREKILSADWQAIATYPWISTPAKCSFNQITARMFAKHGVMPKTVIETDQEMTLKKLVSSNIGLTLLREDVALAAEAMGELVIWPSGLELSHLYFIYSHTEESSPALKSILSIVKEVWQLPVSPG